MSDIYQLPKRGLHQKGPDIVIHTEIRWCREILE